MKNKANVIEALHSPKRPDDVGNLPVLTDVLVPSADAQGRTLWLAWDDQRLPVLSEEIKPADEPTLPRWARKRI
jgi:hypothetical protein